MITLPVTFNDVRLDKYLVVTNLKRGVGTGRSNTLNKLGMTTGEFYGGYTKDAKVYEMEFAIIGDVLTKRRQLAGILDVAEPTKLIFGDEPDKYVLAIPDGNIDVEENRSSGTGTISWIIPDGVSHAVSESTFEAVTNEDGILQMEIQNDGTETTELSFEATMTADNGFIGAIGPLGAVEIGKINEVDGYIDMAELIYKNEMFPKDAAQWSVNNGYICWKKSGNNLDNKIQGTFEWPNEYARVKTFGTEYNDNRWYGPTLSRAIPAKKSDGRRDGNFLHRVQLTQKSNKVGTNKKDARLLGRQEFNLSDGQNPILTFTIYDGSANAFQTVIEFWIFGVKVEKIFVNNDFKEFYGVVDFLLVDNQVTFKVYNIDTKKTITKTYYDERLGAAQVTHTTYWVSKYKKYGICNTNYSYSMFQWIGTQEFVDVPNKYSEGDIIRFEGSTGKVYLNDTINMGDLVQGSTDIKIPPGAQKVEFYYSEFGKTAPIIKGTMRKRWL